MAHKHISTDLFVRLDDVEARVLQQECDRHALSKSEYIRRLIFAAHQGQVAIPMSQYEQFKRQQTK